MTRSSLAVIAAFSLACAASDEDGRSAGRADWTTSIDTIGDTVVVRTTGGDEQASVHALVPEVAIGELDAVDEYSFGAINEVEVSEEGHIYVFDRQVPALREYDATGKYVRTIGQKGEGPGEYTQVNGVALHRDGRIVLWSARTGQINVYGPDGTFREGWRVPGGSNFFTSGGVFMDTAGNTYIRSRIGDPPPASSGATMRPFGATGLVRWGPDGKVVDSLAPPPATIEPPSLMASTKSSMSMTSLPYAPRHVWAWSPLGYFVSAQTDRYAVTLSSPDGKIRRVEREVAPVPVTSDERTDAEERITASMRNVDPTWRWSGPSVPDVKAPIAGIFPADDGRIWVSVARQGERVPEDEMPAPPSVQVGPVDPRRPRVAKWRDPVVYDVFDPDGSFLGRVAAPPRTTLETMRGDHVWAVARDSLDVQQVVRYRVVPGFSPQPVDSR